MWFRRQDRGGRRVEHWVSMWVGQFAWFLNMKHINKLVLYLRRHRRLAKWRGEVWLSDPEEKMWMSGQTGGVSEIDVFWNFWPVLLALSMENPRLVVEKLFPPCLLQASFEKNRCLLFSNMRCVFNPKNDDPCHPFVYFNHGCGLILFRVLPYKQPPEKLISWDVLDPPWPWWYPHGRAETSMCLPKRENIGYNPWVCEVWRVSKVDDVVLYSSTCRLNLTLDAEDPPGLQIMFRISPWVFVCES